MPLLEGTKLPIRHVALLEAVEAQWGCICQTKGVPRPILRDRCSKEALPRVGRLPGWRVSHAVNHGPRFLRVGQRRRNRSWLRISSALARVHASRHNRGFPPHMPIQQHSISAILGSDSSNGRSWPAADRQVLRLGQAGADMWLPALGCRTRPNPAVGCPGSAC